MKKVIAAVAVLGILALPWAASTLQAATNNLTVDVVMSIESIDMTSVRVLDAVAVPVASSKVVRAGSGSGRVVYTNTGNVAVDFSVRIASTTPGTGGWTSHESATNPVPASKYRLRAIWAGFFASTMSLATSDFDDDDILTSSNQLSTSAVFFSGVAAVGKVGTFATNGGTNVQVAGVGDNARHLFFRFDSGAATTTGSSTANVNVTASAAP